MSKIDLHWHEVRLPGVRSPKKNGTFSFLIDPNQPGIARAAFDGKPPISRSSLICFELHSPTSKSMYPDIIRGDYGFPTVCLKNSEGTVYRFARGNIKDFFDIRRPNTKQVLKLPVAAFVYDRDLKSNVPDNYQFFSHPVVNVSFDFLRHPTDEIDMEIGNVWLEEDASTQLAVQDLVIFTRNSQAAQFPDFSSESEAASFAVALSNVGMVQGAAGALLTIKATRKGEVTSTSTITLKNENTYLTIKLPKLGHYTIEARIERDGKLVATSSWPMCRVIGRTPQSKPTVLGISDAYNYDRIAAAGGTWDRLPTALLSITKRSDGSLAFIPGNDVLPVTVPGGNRRRVFAPFYMPKWLSKRADKPDYYRYGATDWQEYSRLITYVAERAKAAGVTHYEAWNEASALGHWDEDMDTLIELHKATYSAVKAVDPTMTVMGGCTHSWTFDFLERFLQAGGADYCDGLAVHGYTYRPDECQELFNKLESLIEKYVPGRPDFKIYLTELGFRAPAFSLDDQAKYLALFTLEAASRSRVDAVLWFRYGNPRPEVLSGYKQDSSMGYGLVGYASSYCRPAFAAYRMIDRLLQTFDSVEASGTGKARSYSLFLDGNHSALVTTEHTGPAGWTALDLYGAPADDADEWRIYVDPKKAAILR